MFFGPGFGRSIRLRQNASWSVLFILLLLPVFPFTGLALPKRLILGLDGIAYRDLKALQEGAVYTNLWGRTYHCQAFTAAEGYFPVSRMISTFPSTSDVAWTDIFGDRPLPGYQRTYFSDAANSQIIINGITTTMEHESQMTWQLENNLLRTMAYMYPVHTYAYEIYETIGAFWGDTNNDGNFYVYIRATDDAQHLDRNIFDMLCSLDKQLQDMRDRYQKQEGRDLEILIISDHGHNHADTFKRVQVRPFLENAGYRITESIQNSNDVVLPTTGIEDWVEIHNSPAATMALVPLLTGQEGVDLVTARDPNNANRFLVMNSQGQRAAVDWNPTNDTYRYSPEKGDPLNYQPVVESLAQQKRLAADGFATSDAWMTATMTNHYPLAPERIAHGLTRVTLNPATILISLKNDYVHANWLILRGADLSTFGSTHGALDHINSDGVILANFKPTHDSSTARVADQFDNFPGLRNFRAEENGAEFVTREGQSLTRIPHEPLDTDYRSLPANEVFLRVWSPQLAHLDNNAPVHVMIEKVKHFSEPQNPRLAPKPRVLGRQLVFSQPVTLSDPCAYERVYALPPDLNLKPLTEYRISGWVRGQDKSVPLFEFNFRTDSQGRPVAY
jgi:hypothetical protein